jgi:predicted XRE-type DNA-binding protein
MKFPSKKVIEEILSSLGDDDYSVVQPDNASEVDKIKFELCAVFVVYLNRNKVTQTELAEKLEVDKSRINWIVKYRIEHFSIDYLYTLSQKLNPKITLKIIGAA